MKITLEKKQIETAIIDYLNSKFKDSKIKNIEFNVGTRQKVMTICYKTVADPDSITCEIDINI